MKSGVINRSKPVILFAAVWIMIIFFCNTIPDRIFVIFFTCDDRNPYP